MRLALSLARRIRKGPPCGPELRIPRQPCGCALSLSLHSALHPKMQSALSPRIARAKVARSSLARRIRKGPLSGPELHVPRQPCGCALSLSIHSALHPKMQSALSPRIARAKAARSSLAQRIKKGPLSGPELRVPRQPCGCASEDEKMFCMLSIISLSLRRNLISTRREASLFSVPSAL